MEPEVILVDTADRQIGTAKKLDAHRTPCLHRAFSVFAYSGSEMLLQRRADGKYHSAGLWANTCCSHPRPGEGTGDAARRRMAEETGVDAAPEERFSFVYLAEFDNGLFEYELDHVFLAEIPRDARLEPDPEEIAELRWISFTDLRRELVEQPLLFAKWFLIACPRVLEELENRTC